MNTIKKELKDYKLLLKNVPSMVVSVFILSVVCMNLLANKELYNSKYFCIDCGQMISWIPFLCMDCICKRFGGKASAKISILAMLINVVTVVIFKLLTMTPGHWAEYYGASGPAVADAIDNSLSATFGGAWYVVMGSAIAMLVSSIVNSISNMYIGRIADKGGFKGFAIRSYISTALGQWVDNLVFTSLVSHVFFGWNWMQVIICSTVSMVIELVAEMIFSPIGYRAARDWEKEDVGKEYISQANAA